MIQQKIKKNTLIIERQQHKYLTNIKPAPPKLNIHIKTHKHKQPIRPAINNTQAPAYKLAKHMNKKLQQLLNLPNTYNTKNTQEIAEDLRSIRIKETNRVITLDINDLYVNLPINGILNATKHWLQMNNNEGTTITQILNVTKTILEQNYFQYNEAIFKTKKGIAMGSPISGTMAEVYLQYVESTHINNGGRQWRSVSIKDMWMTY